MEILEAPGGLTEARLSKFEKRHRVTLPEDYRKFLLTYNGGRPNPRSFKIRDLKTKEQIVIRGHEMSSSSDLLYSISDVDDYTFDDIIETFADRIPADTIPIGRDPGGNQILLTVKGEHIGTVYFWDHEDEYEEGETPGYRNVSFIADSFTSFLEGLTKYELPAKYRK